MPVTTLEELRNQLSAIEPDDSTYAGIGVSELSLLEQLTKDEEAWMAARAVFALSRVPDPGALTILSQTATDPRPAVRVAVAASVSNLKADDSNDLLQILLTDSDAGVRQFAVQSVSEGHDAAVHAKLQGIGTGDPVPWVRDAGNERIAMLKLP